MKLSQLRNWDRDDMLGMLGLERRRPVADVMGGVGLFAAGILAGAGLGLLFAPKRGGQARRQMGDMIRRGKRQLQAYAGRIGEGSAASAGATTSSGR